MKISNIKVDKMRYQTNSLCYILVMLSVGLSVLALFTLITYDSFGKGASLRVEPDFRIGLEIALGIVLLLTTFLAAEKVKYRDVFWSRYGLFILAGINFLRIFNIPIYAHKNGWIPTYIKFLATTELILAAIILTLAGLISMTQVMILKNYMKEMNKNGDSNT